ncbi:uncharacterized protein LOC107261692 [Ricinus communis]|uniref:uncharacterized protein LOC107261692 n=1 Tax=Ricinus communis TaxID=3988 RepID=UPI0007727B9B|nr:uncharacterized protein LOC107261692 [Ricinus communis]|eukprot:XP_015578179.1 uncharacterized protein LOC107261692 [Ricinus communis]
MQLLLIPDSTTLNYWLNWRVLLCAISVLTPMLGAVFILWKREGLDHLRSCRGKSQQEIISNSLYEDRAWRPCLDQIDPIWLLFYRVIAFSVLLASLIAKISVNGFLMFFYYTQWTFTSVTFYFGFGILLSICGCYQYHRRGRAHSGNDAEQAYHVPLLYEERTNMHAERKLSNPRKEVYVSQVASISSYLFQVLFQMNAGAVMLTDCVYWAIIFPFLTIKDYTMNFMTVNMHTLNVLVLLGDAALNCLPFPWFRVSYFILWTGAFVIFQWILHACTSTWWPYPFLDLSSPYAPLWYLLVGLMHFPCYGFFVLIVKMKHELLANQFPQSYRCLR